jgi:hypothetical protein
MPENDKPPAQSTTLAPGAGLVSTALVGTPLAVVTVSLLNRTVFKAQPLTVEEAVAFGTAGAAVLGYFFHIAEVLIGRRINR